MQPLANSTVYTQGNVTSEPAHPCGSEFGYVGTALSSDDDSGDINNIVNTRFDRTHGLQNTGVQWLGGEALEAEIKKPTNEAQKTFVAKSWAPYPSKFDYPGNETEYKYDKRSIDAGEDGYKGGLWSPINIRSAFANAYIRESSVDDINTIAEQTATPANPTCKPGGLYTASSDATFNKTTFTNACKACFETKWNAPNTKQAYTYCASPSGCKQSIYDQFSSPSLTISDIDNFKNKIVDRLCTDYANSYYLQQSPHLYNIDVKGENVCSSPSTCNPL